MDKSPEKNKSLEKDKSSEKDKSPKKDKSFEQDKSHKKDKPHKKDKSQQKQHKNKKEVFRHLKQKLNTERERRAHKTGDREGKAKYLKNIKEKQNHRGSEERRWKQKDEKNKDNKRPKKRRLYGKISK